MRSTFPSYAQQSSQATRETPTSAALPIPATHFKSHFVVGGGDCLFQALCMGSTNQPVVPVSMEHIMSLRQDAANYVAEHRAALIDHPSFGGEAGVNALYGLLITQGQWNEDAGDLVPPILARVLGREIRILEPTQHGDSYDANENRIFRPQDTDTGLPPAKPNTGQPPIYLAHISRAHYEYLKPRDPQVNATPESITTDLVGHPSDASSLGSTSTSRWFDLLLNEENNSPTDGIHHPPSPQSFSLGRVSSFSSLESYSSRGFLEKLDAKARNSSTDDVSQPPRKKSRHTDLRSEQEDRMTEPRTPSSWGKRQVTSKAARAKIKKTFEEMNNRPFETLTSEEQEAEMMRISGKTGYRPSGIRVTLSGDSNNQVTTQADRNEITNAFIKTTRNRTFKTLTQDQQTAEVMRISRETGYCLSGVRATLVGEGKRKVTTQAAKTKITKAFTDMNNRPFKSLTQDQKTAEVMRISQETGYRSYGVLTTLTGGGNKPVATPEDKNEITAAFAETNNRPFEVLTKEEQAAEVRRISRGTGYNHFGVQTTLIGGGNRPAKTHRAKTKITNAFTEATNNRPFDALTKEEQDAEAIRISRKTGYRLSEVWTTLNGLGNRPTGTHMARTDIMKEFTEAANGRPFDALTKEEQTAEVTRISRKTGYCSSGVLDTLTGVGNKRIRSKTARDEVTTAFTSSNNRPFSALTKEEQAAEVMRISRETGYNPSAVRTTLTGRGNRQIATQMARNEITTAFTSANNCPFGALTKKEQTAEVTRISRKTKYNPTGVRATLNGEGNRAIAGDAARNKVKTAFTKVNSHPFEALTQEQQDAEVVRISQKTGYNPSAVLTTLTGLGNKQVTTQVARNEITTAFIKANSSGFDVLTPEKQDTEVTRISQETGYRRSGVLTTLTGGGNKSAGTQAAINKIMTAFTEAANHRPFDALTPEEQDAEVTRISRKTGYNPSAVRTTLNGEGNKPVTTQTARNEITNVFAEEHDSAFDALRQDQQTIEVARISRKTGYNPLGVWTTLNGLGNKRIRSQAARNKVMTAFTEAANHRPFDALTPEEQDAEVTRISRKTGYNPSAVRTTLNGEGNKSVTTQAARNEATNAFSAANNYSFETLTEEEQTAEVTRISQETGYNLSGVLNTLTGEGTKQVLTQTDRVQITKAFTEANNRPFEALTKKEQASEVLRISREMGYTLSATLMALIDKK